MKYRHLLLSTLSLALSACSNEMRYNMLHDTAKQNCRNIPNPQERFECEQQYDQPYGDYKNAREHPESR